MGTPIPTQEPAIELVPMHCRADKWDLLKTIYPKEIPKKANVKKCSNYYTTALISHACKVMLKILQVRLQQYMNDKLPDVQAGFRKGRGTRDQIANIHWIIEKAREVQKNIYFCFIDYAKFFVWITINCGEFWKRWEYQTTWPPSWEICAQVRKQQLEFGHGTTDWFQIGKGVHQGCILSLCLLNFYAEYIMRNAGLDEAQAGIKTAGRNINNLRYADDTTLMADSEQELDESERGEWKSWLKVQLSEN